MNTEPNITNNESPAPKAIEALVGEARRLLRDRQGELQLMQAVRLLPRMSYDSTAVAGRTATVTSLIPAVGF